MLSYLIILLTYYNEWCCDIGDHSDVHLIRTKDRPTISLSAHPRVLAYTTERTQHARQFPLVVLALQDCIFIGQMAVSYW